MAGLTCLHFRLVVARMSRRLKSSATDKQRRNLANERQRLVSRITKFHNDSRQYIPSLPELPRDDGNLGAEWDDDGEVGLDPVSSGGDEDSEDVDVDQPDLFDILDIDPNEPERQSIALPSTLGYGYIKQHKLRDIALELRQLLAATMNDALEKIRLGIGYKSLIYRTKVRNARGTRARLRSFDEIHSTDEGVQRQVRIYCMARKHIQKLFDNDNSDDASELATLLRKYRPIARKDLKAETTLVESFMAGQRNKHASWLWHFEDIIEGNTKEFGESSK